jgi:Domain of unknown function (DUF4262)
MEPVRVDSVRTLLLQVSRQLHDHGWALISTPYCGQLFQFTLGLREHHGHPDLETLGLGDELGRGLLTALVQRILAGQRFRPGDFFSDLVRGYDLFLVDNPLALDGPPLTGGRLRLVWPDAAHRYPWHADCDAACAVQRLLPCSEGLELPDLQVLLAHSRSDA